jgi:cytochrome c oxidase subunit I+III
VRSRHPLWDQDDLTSGPPALERFVHALSRWPLRWRAAAIVGTVDGRPQEVFRVAGPSIWPLFTGCGLVLIFLAELTKFRWAVAVGALIIVVGVIAWNWPQAPPMTEDEEAEFERDTGVPVNAGGSVVVAAWGMGLVILFMAIAFATLLLAYFYLRLENPEWPAAGLGDPALGGALLAGALVVASGVADAAGLARLRAADVRGFALALLAAIGLAGAGLVLQYLDVGRLGIDGNASSYGSIFQTMAGFVYVSTTAALIMLAMTLFWALRGQFSARRYAPVVNVARFHAAAVVVWVVGFGTLYLGPALT